MALPYTKYFAFVVVVVAFVFVLVIPNLYNWASVSVVKRLFSGAMVVKQVSADDEGGSNLPAIIYSKLRDDRSGAAIQDMLFAHAYAYNNHRIYGGACPMDGPVQHDNAHRRLIQALGLQHILIFDCPPHIINATREPNATDDAILEDHIYTQHIAPTHGLRNGLLIFGRNSVAFQNL
jgi:hypothetical protein